MYAFLYYPIYFSTRVCIVQVNTWTIVDIEQCVSTCCVYNVIFFLCVADYKIIVMYWYSIFYIERVVLYCLDVLVIFFRFSSIWIQYIARIFINIFVDMVTNIFKIIFFFGVSYSFSTVGGEFFIIITTTVVYVLLLKKFDCVFRFAVLVY